MHGSEPFGLAVTTNPMMVLAAAHREALVNGHRVFPTGGHEFPHWWPSFLPAGGHEFPHQQIGLFPVSR
jgi:hypothetical protein